MKEAILRSGIDLLTMLALLPAATNMTHRDLLTIDRADGWNSKCRSERGVDGYSVMLPN